MIRRLVAVPREPVFLDADAMRGPLCRRVDGFRKRNQLDGGFRLISVAYRRFRLSYDRRGVDMIETPQQYTQRILGYVDGRPPLEVQAATAAALGRLIQGVPPARLRARPAPDRWSVNDIVAHLADAEIVIGFRLRLILGSPGAPIAAYDQGSWVTSGHYDKRDPRKSVEQFRVLRDANLALLDSLEPEQWQLYGVHSERGRETIEDMVRMAAGHDINHLRQIESVLIS